MTCFYTAYGLMIRSSVCLPELEPLPGPVAADVIDLVIDVDQGSLDKYTSSMEFIQITPDEVRLTCSGVGAFLVRQGREVIVTLVPDHDQAALRMLITGIVLAIVLVQRGRMVLHASAVAINGRAIIFLGNKGAGKSVMAGSLHRHGHRMLADDTTVVKLDSVSLMVYSSPPRFKLWPDAIEALGRDSDTLPRLHPDLEKRSLQITHDGTTAMFPLDRLYVLAEGPEPRVVKLSAAAAFIEIVRHTYASRWMTTPDPDHFQQCVALTNRVEVYRLERPRQFTALPAVIQLLEEVHALDFCK